MFEVDAVVAYSGGAVVPLPTGQLLFPCAGGIATIAPGHGRNSLYVPGDGQHSISSVAVHPQGTILCVTETRLKVALLVVQLPDKRQLQRIPDVARGSVSSMSFSRDGSIFVLLSGLPLHGLSVFSVDGTTQRLTPLYSPRQPAPHHFTSVSVSPRSNFQFCTTGGGHLAFWQYDGKANQFSPTLPVAGRVNEADVSLTCHVWSANGQHVVAGTTDGELFLFDASTGLGNRIAQGTDAGPVTALTLHRHGLVTCFKNGVVQIRTQDGNEVLKSMLLPHGQHCVHMTRLPGWNAFCVGSAAGQLTLLQLPGLDNPSLSLEEVAVIPQRTTPLLDHGRTSTGCKFLAARPDGGPRLVTVSYNDDHAFLQLQDLDENRVLAKLAIHGHLRCGPSPVTSLDVGSDFTSHFVVVTLQNGFLCVVSTRELSEPRIAYAGRLSTKSISCALIMPGGQRCILRIGALTLMFFDLSALRPIAVVTIPDSYEGIADVTPFPRAMTHVMLSMTNSAVLLLRCPAQELPLPETAAPPSLSFEEVFVNAWRVELPLNKIVVGAVFDEQINVFGQSLDRETKLFVFDRTQPADRKDRETKAVRCTMPFKDHEKRGSGIFVMNRTQLVTTGGDGRLVVRDIAPLLNQSIALRDLKKEPVFVAAKHSSLAGGIASFSCHSTGEFLLTTGADQSVILWTSAQYSGRSVPALSTIPTPPPIAEAMDGGATDESDGGQLLIWEKRRVESDNVQWLQHSAAREETLKKVALLRQKAILLRKENESVEDDEKVPIENFLVQRERNRFEKNVRDVVDKVKDDARWSDLRNDYIVDKLKNECWDTMEAKLTPIETLNALPTADGSTPCVYNFHLRAREPRDLELLRKMKFLRRVEELDRKARGVQELSSIVDQPDGEEQEGASAPPELLPPATRTNVEAEAADDVTPYLYPRRLVFTRQRSILQTFLLGFKSHALKMQFNKRFEELAQQKKNEISKVEERNVRCRQVQKELDDATPLFTATLSRLEKPELLFTVVDTEVPADISTNPDEKRRRAADEAERERWRRVHGTDDSSDRALKQWMDGRLEKEEHLLEIKVDKPDFADETSPKFVLPEERSDEQNKLFKDYQTRLNKRIEEVAKRKKELQTELTDLQKANLDAAVKFDALVQSLLISRLIVSQKCFEVDLQQVKLAEGILTHRSRQAVLSTLEKQRQHLADKLTSITSNVSKFTKDLDEKRNHVSDLVAQEKSMEKGLKTISPFAESDFAERISKIYLNAKRKQPKKAGGGAAAAPPKGGKAKTASDAATSWITCDPYAILDREEEARKKLTEEEMAAIPVLRVDRPSDVPDDIWAAFQDFLDQRADGERTVKLLNDEIVDATRELASLAQQEEQARKSATDTIDEVRQHASAAVDSIYDIDDLFVLRQGQVEVEQAPIVTEYGDALLCYANRVLELNGEIRQRGQGKVSLLREMHDKRQENRFIEWENQDLEMRSQVVQMNFRHLHTLRVTKQMQEFIHGGGEDHNEKQRLKLIKKIEHVQQSMSSKIEDRRVQMQKIKRQAREQEMENTLLMDQVTEAQRLVDTRRSIHQLQSSELERERNDKLMRDMRVTRKLEDVAKAQQSEMIELKRDIDRLRERTFPSFAVVSKRVIGNPDEA